MNVQRTITMRAVLAGRRRKPEHRRLHGRVRVGSHSHGAGVRHSIFDPRERTGPEQRPTYRPSAA